MAFIEPLNLEYLLINTLAGSPTIFIFLAILSIAVLAAMFKMPNIIFLVMIGLFAIVFGYLGGVFSGLYAFFIIIASVVTFYSVGKIFK